MLIVARRSNARSACSHGFKPILSKCANCRATLQMETSTSAADALSKRMTSESERTYRRAPECSMTKGADAGAGAAVAALWT